MTALFIDQAVPGTPFGDFYSEWERRPPGARRSLRRAALLAERLGLTVPGPPVLTVVGSKGKGTAATYASAWLAAAGLRVLTVTSPSLRRDTERIRVDGVAVSDGELAGLGRRLRQAYSTLPPEPGGYLSPSGLFTLAGLLHARAAGADIAVLEAGMGGVSDEVGLFPPSVLAITEIFAEHLGVLGDTPAEIAVNKAGIAAASTSAVVSLPQAPDVAEAIAATIRARTGRAAEVAQVSRLAARHDPTAGADLPSGLGRANAILGCVAARRLASVTGRTPPDRDRLSRVLTSVRLPGRVSWHTVCGTTLLVDSAIGRPGAAAALAEAYRRWDRVDHVLVCLPDHKDVAGVLGELDGLPVTCVRMPDRPDLRFSRTRGIDVSDITRERLVELGERVLVLGTVYFTGRILDLTGARTDRLFEA